MAESDWQDPEAPKKRRVPSWVWWGCGGGCLLFAIIGVVLLVLGATFFKDVLDPEKAWPGVQEVLPYDQRPEGWDARGTTVMGVGQYFLQPPGHTGEMLLVFRFNKATDIDGFFDPGSPQNRGVLTIGEIQDPRPGTIELQGRTVRCLRFVNWKPGADDEDQGQPSLRIDVTGSGAIGAAVQIMANQDVTDERAQELLAPFDVWRGK